MLLAGLGAGAAYLSCFEGGFQGQPGVAPGLQSGLNFLGRHKMSKTTRAGMRGFDGMQESRLNLLRASAFHEKF